VRDLSGELPKENQNAGQTLMSSRAVNRALNGLFATGCLPDSLRFHGRLKKVQSVQKAKLLHIIRRNRDTEFGRIHGFERIRTIEDYRKNVPVGCYEGFEPYIGRIADGEKEVLTKEDVLLLEPTGGTGSGSKWIPYTQSLKKEFQAAVHTWLFDLYRHHSSLLASKSYWSVTPLADGEQRTRAGIPVGFEDDAEYMGRLGRALRAVFAVPPSIKKIRNMENFRYGCAFYLLSAEDLGLISIWNPTFLALLIDGIEQYRESLTRDIFEGRIRLPFPEEDSFDHPAPLPSHPRARLLEAAFQKERGIRHHEIWPNLKIISCWADGASRAHADEIASSFPGVRIQPKGLLATECIVSFPLEQAGGSVLAYGSHFLEFLPADDEKPRLAHQLEKGGLYTVVVTTGGGLYRYNMQDRIEVTDHWKGLPVIRFLERSRVSDLVGEKLAEGHVQTLLEELLAELGIAYHFILFAPEIDSKAAFYTLFIEPSTPLSSTRETALIEAIEVRLKDNYHYAYARRLGQLEKPRIMVLPKGAGREAYLRRCLESGQRLGDIKTTCLDRRTGWRDYFV